MCIHIIFSLFSYTHIHTNSLSLRIGCVCLQPDVNDAVVEALRAVKAAL